MAERKKWGEGTLTNTDHSIPDVTRVARASEGARSINTGGSNPSTGVSGALVSTEIVCFMVNVIRW